MDKAFEVKFGWTAIVFSEDKDEAEYKIRNLFYALRDFFVDYETDTPFMLKCDSVNYEKIGLKKVPLRKSSDE